jgi:enterochelin esterase-like enzyme
VGLTSGLFEVLTVGLAVAGAAAVVWLWPRAAGRRIWHAGARMAMLAVSEILVVAAFLVCMNSYFSFYTSWTQLTGSGQAPVAGAARAALFGAPVLTITKAGPAPAPGAPVGNVPSMPAIAAGPEVDLMGLIRHPHEDLAETGELLGISVNGPHTGIAVTGDYVYLPPQYFQPAYAHSRFPAVLGLTGYPGSSWSMVKRLRIPAEAQALGSKIRPAVYVMMNVSVAMPRDTECTNVPAGQQVETFFAEDVPQAIEHSFRVYGGPGGWAALGYSTGGYCAVKIAMMNPGRFSLAVSLAGYYDALQDRTTGNLYGGSTGYREENSPDWRLQHFPAPPVSVLVASSRIGENTYPGTLAFLALVRPPMRAYSLFLAQGGHNFATWGRELPQSLEWLSTRLTPAIPAAGIAVPAAHRVLRPGASTSGRATASTIRADTARPHRCDVPGHSSAVSLDIIPVPVLGVLVLGRFRGECTE